MDTRQIDDILRSRCKLYRGTFALDQLLEFNFDRDSANGSSADSLMIVNTEKSNHPGTHWQGIQLGGDGRGFFFDSFGRRPTSAIERFMNKHCKNGWDYNEHQIQSVLSDYCAPFCIQFCLYMCKYNNDFSKMLRLYTNDTMLNNRIVHTFMKSIAA